MSPLATRSNEGEVIAGRFVCCWGAKVSRKEIRTCPETSLSIRTGTRSGTHACTHVPRKANTRPSPHPLIHVYPGCHVPGWVPSRPIHILPTFPRHHRKVLDALSEREETKNHEREMNNRRDSKISLPPSPCARIWVSCCSRARGQPQDKSSGVISSHQRLKPK